MDRNSPSTATQANSGMTRRGVIKKGVIASGTTLGVGYGGIGSAAAVAPVLIGAAAGGAALGYLMKEGVDKILGDTRDYSGYTGGDALKKEIYAGALEMVSADERVMTSIENNIQDSKNVALAKGKAAVIEKMNSGASESTAQTAMETAINEYYATIQKNILTHYQAQIKQVKHQFDSLVNHSNTSPGDVMEMRYNPGTQYADWIAITPTVDNTGTTDVSLLNGNSVTIDYFHLLSDTGSSAVSRFDWKPEIDLVSGGVKTASSTVILLRYSDPSSNSSETVEFPFHRSVQAYEQITIERDSVLGTLSGFVTDVYSEYQPGDIPTAELVDPITAATELEQSYGGDAGQSAFASMLGIPTSAKQAVKMDVHRSEGTVTIQADIYTDYVPPTTGEFKTGTKYDPTAWDKPLYIAYEYTAEDGTESSEFAQLEDPFTIVNISVDGNEIDTFTPKTQNNQTADVSALEEELAQVREEKQRLQNEAEEEKAVGGGGGGGFLDFGGDSRTLGIVAGAGAILLLLMGNG